MILSCIWKNPSSAICKKAMVREYDVKLTIKYDGPKCI